MKHTTRTELKLHPLKPLPLKMNVHGTDYEASVICRASGGVDHIIYKAVGHPDLLKVENR
jgi:hypothetical protein